MKKMLKGGVVAIAAAGAVAAGLALGAGLAAVAFDGPAPFPVNSQGQTYGPGFDEAGSGDMPDLVLAYGQSTNGDMVEGYLLRSDLQGPSDMTPEEAARWSEAQGDSDVTIPLYKSDGVTVIGTFTMTGGGVSYTTSPPEP